MAPLGLFLNMHGAVTRQSITYLLLVFMGIMQPRDSGEPGFLWPWVYEQDTKF